MDLPRLSPATQELLNQLWSAPPFLERVFGSVDRRITLLEQIGKSGEIAAIPSLLELLVESSSAVSQAASDCLDRLVRDFSVQHFPALDDSVRSVVWWYGKSRWGQLRLSDLPNVLAIVESRSSILGLLSLHKNGYLREAAIQELDRIEDGSELPFLLLRLNDWVVNVRSSAKSAVERRLRPEYLPHFVRAIYLVVRLIECGRDDHGHVIQWVVRQLVSPKHEQVLRDLLQNESPLVRRTTFQLACNLDDTHRDWLLSAGLQSNDLVVRLRAAQLVHQSKRYGELIPLMERDHYMPVRREALLARIEQHSDTVIPFLESALMDRSGSMRELARFYLAKMERQDVSEVYRHAVAEEHDLAVSLAGLGETGQQNDIHLVRAYLNAPKVSVRVAAIRAFGRLGGEGVCDDILPFLNNEKTKITQAAGQGLSGCLDKLKAEQLWQCVGESPRPHVARTVLELLDRHGSWSGLPYLIRFSASSDQDIAYQAKQYVLRRINSVFSSPTPEDKARIEHSLKETERELDAAFLKDVRTWLRIRGVLKSQ